LWNFWFSCHENLLGVDLDFDTLLTSLSACLLERIEHVGVIVNMVAHLLLPSRRLAAFDSGTAPSCGGGGLSCRDGRRLLETFFLPFEDLLAVMVPQLDDVD
jgi:hypothetical protein